jgi:Arc/MetJ-type ribon-helix-helix transcriptional regulator
MIKDGKMLPNYLIFAILLLFDNMLNKSVRIPKRMLNEIDGYVGEDKFYSSRTDFVLSGMRQLVYTYAQKKREMLERYNMPLTNVVIEQTFSSITKLYLDSFDRYDGETTQVNVRTPGGLWNQISLLLKREYGYEKLADFPRAAVMCLLIHLKDTDDILNETEKFMEEQNKLRQDIYQIVMEGLKNNLSGPEIINDTYQKMMAKHVDNKPR